MGATDDGIEIGFEFIDMFDAARKEEEKRPMDDRTPEEIEATKKRYSEMLERLQGTAK